MKQSINLIVNADDLGAGDPTDRGIIEAFTTGIVTSASLLANGPSFDSATRLAREVKLPIGVHLNLSEGASLTGVLPGITDDTGQFLGKQESRTRFLNANIDTVALHTEFLAQIDKVKSSGLQPDHVDTHQHCGLFPSVSPALISAARDAGIYRMRLPVPTHTQSEEPDSPLADDLRLYRSLAPDMTNQLLAADIKTPDGLLGMPLLDQLDEENLALILRQLTPGDWELMVHPGYFDPDRSFAGTEREKELTALTSESVDALIRHLGIKLISFKELPCAC